MLCESFMDYDVKTKLFFGISSELSAKHVALNSN